MTPCPLAQRWTQGRVGGGGRGRLARWLRACARTLGLLGGVGLALAQPVQKTPPVQKAPPAAHRIATAAGQPAQDAGHQPPARSPTPAAPAAAASGLVLRLAVPQGGVSAELEMAPDGSLTGALAQWLLPAATTLGLRVQAVVVPSDAAALQALRDGAADMALAAQGMAVAAAATEQPVRFTLGTGAQALALFAPRERPPVPLDRARVAVLVEGAWQPPARPAPQASAGDSRTSEPFNSLPLISVAADRLRRHHPAAQALPQPSVLAALQAVAGLQPRAASGGPPQAAVHAPPQADLALLPLLPALQALQQQAVPGLELRQVLPGAAGHYHLALSAQLAAAMPALLPALNRLIINHRNSGAAHQAVLRYAQSAAPGLLAPLALPADGPAFAAEVMASLVKPPFTLKANAVERQLLADQARWRVGAVRAVGAGTGADETRGTDAAPGADALLHIDAGGRPGGVAADTVQEVAQRLGVWVDWVPFDSETALLEALHAGRIDWLPLLQHTPEQARTLVFSLPWLELPQVLVGRVDGPLYWGLDSLRGRRLALPVGAAGAGGSGAPVGAAAQALRSDIQRLYPGIQIVDARDTAAALALVAQGQADAALDLKPLVSRVLASPAGAGLRALGDVTELPAQYRFAGSDRLRGLVPLLDAALLDVPAAERQRSLRRWVARDLQPQRLPWQRAPLRWAGGAALLALLAGVGLGTWRVRRQLRRPQAPGLDMALVRPPSAGQAAPPAALQALADVPSLLPDVPPPLQEVRPPPPVALPVLPDVQQQPQNMHLAQWLDQVVSAQRASAELRGVRLNWRVDPVLPARVHADPQRLAQLLHLLLALAIEHSPQGRVLVNVSVATLGPVADPLAQAAPRNAGAQSNASAGRPALVFEVRDSRGMVQQPLASDLFAPVAEAPASAPAPPGLAPAASDETQVLQLCSQLVSLMEGRLSRHDKPGAGAVARVLVPLRGATRSAPADA